MSLFTEITASNLPDLITQVNSTFAKIFELPNIRGTKGDTGDTVIGSPGIRGANITTISLADINTLFSTTFTSNTLTIAAFNSLLASDFASVELSTLFNSIIDGDLLILPNGKLLQYVSATNTAVDTGIDLSGDELFVTTTEVQQIVDAAIATTLSGTASTIDAFTWVGKKYSDTDINAALNSVLYADSVLDTGRSGTVQALLSPSIQSLYTNGKTMFVGPNMAAFLAQIQSNLDTPGGIAKELDTDSLPWLTVLHDSPTGIAIGNSSTLGYGLFGHVSKNASQELVIGNKIGLEQIVITDTDAEIPLQKFTEWYTAAPALIGKIPAFDAIGDMTAYELATGTTPTISDTVVASTNAVNTMIAADKANTIKEYSANVPGAVSAVVHLLTPATSYIPTHGVAIVKLTVLVYKPAADECTAAEITHVYQNQSGTIVQLGPTVTNFIHATAGTPVNAFEITTDGTYIRTRVITNSSATIKATVTYYGIDLTP